MELKQVTPLLSVAAAIRAEDISDLVAAGYQAVINNRFDGEEDNQVSSAVLQETTTAAGLEYTSLPVVPGKISDADIEAFTSLLKSLPGPVLAFCRTGTRAINLWALSEARHLDVDVILAAASKHGYDLENLRPRLLERAAAESTD